MFIMYAMHLVNALFIVSIACLHVYNYIVIYRYSIIDLGLSHLNCACEFCCGFAVMLHIHCARLYVLSVVRGK